LGLVRLVVVAAAGLFHSFNVELERRFLSFHFLL
jgi:hypothetical protein